MSGSIRGNIYTKKTELLLNLTKENGWNKMSNTFLYENFMI